MKTNSTTFTGNGYALGQTVSGLVVGQQYVLSGFFQTGGLGGNTGQLYLDLSDIPNDLFVHALLGVNQWQFAYDTFTAASTSVTVRIARDGQVTAGEAGYLDNIAVTPLSSFAPPTVASSSAPEPSALALLLPGLAVGVGAIRRKRAA